MKKSILISNKMYEDANTIGLNYSFDNGNAYSIDRIYSIIDDTINYQVIAKSMLLGSFIGYWFYTSDYKKNKELGKKKYKTFNIWYNLFFAICIICLILCVIWGVAIPIVNSVLKSLQLFQGDFTGVVVANDHIVGYVIDGRTSASIINSITGITNNAYPEWFNAYFNNYWTTNAYIGYDPTIDGLIKYLNDSVVGSGSNSTITFLSKQLQVFIYYSVVGKTSGNDILNSWNGNYFVNLLSSNPYSGLRASDICLAGNQLAQTLLVPKIWLYWFNDSATIVPIIFTILLVVIISIYARLFKKVRPKLNSMSFPDYIMTKILFIKKFSFILNKRNSLVEGVKELNHRFVFKVDSLGATNIYFILRLLNYVYATFIDMSIVFVVDINDNDDSSIEELMKIVNQDFSNLCLKVVKNEDLEKLKSPDSSGQYYRYGGSSINYEPINLDIVKCQNQIDICRLQFENYVKDFYKRLNQNLNYKIKLYSTKLKKHNKLTAEEKKAIFEEITTKNQNNTSDFIKKQMELIGDSSNWSIMNKAHNQFNSFWKKIKKKSTK